MGAIVPIGCSFEWTESGTLTRRGLRARKQKDWQIYQTLSRDSLIETCATDVVDDSSMIEWSQDRLKEVPLKSLFVVIVFPAFFVMTCWLEKVYHWMKKDGTPLHVMKRKWRRSKAKADPTGLPIDDGSLFCTERDASLKKYRTDVVCGDAERDFW